LPELLSKMDDRTDYTTASSKPKRASKYLFCVSVAKAVLQIAGLIETKNEKLIKLRENHGRPVEILHTPREERDPDDVADLKKLIKLALEEVFTSADILFTTVVMFTRKLVRGFREKYDFVAIKKAGSCMSGRAHR
jgi:hypothetical protein